MLLALSQSLLQTSQRGSPGMSPDQANALAVWLGQRGLGEWAETLVRHNITLEALPKMTEDHLRAYGKRRGSPVGMKLAGVTALGARKKLVRAAVALVKPGAVVDVVGDGAMGKWRSEFTSPAGDSDGMSVSTIESAMDAKRRSLNRDDDSSVHSNNSVLGQSQGLADYNGANSPPLASSMSSLHSSAGAVHWDSMQQGRPHALERQLAAARERERELVSEVSRLRSEVRRAVLCPHITLT